jgi:hypothetical protein
MVTRDVCVKCIARDLTRMKVALFVLVLVRPCRD